MAYQPEPQWIVVENYQIRSPDGLERSLIIRIGVPYHSSGVWYCPLALEGLMGTTRIAGNSALQALALAVRFIRLNLGTWLQKGGKLRLPDVPDWELTESDLDAVFSYDSH